MTQKKLQKKSKFGSAWDIDGDGEITDVEIEKAKEIQETETKLRKNLAQLRMARYTLIGMGVFTAACFFIPMISEYIPASCLVFSNNFLISDITFMFDSVSANCIK